MPLGIYISVPFCRSKCSYCNFASGVFSAAQMGRYIERLEADATFARAMSEKRGAVVPAVADTIYLGGGTPSLLQPQQLKKLFLILRRQFDLAPEPEITVECAPGTLTPEVVETLAAAQVNRVSLGVQSFVDQEAAAVARLHTCEKTLGDIERLRAAGIGNINVDLIAGLPHQTKESWNASLDQVIATGVPHVSVYMLEIDEDSRLGRELIAGGTRYHAHFVPDGDLTAEFYETACERLNAAGIRQYEISNFARAGYESRHNLKYWTRRPYLGFGVDAHSMLPAAERLQAQGMDSLRFSTTDSFDQFFISPEINDAPVTRAQAVEETFFLGLRLNRGLRMDDVRRDFGPETDKFVPVVEELITDGLLEREASNVRLTARGRLLSNEVFERFISTESAVK
jgi:oxygen-independent coproporphyrinogen III oxidase